MTSDELNHAFIVLINPLKPPSAVVGRLFLLLFGWLLGRCVRAFLCTSLDRCIGGCFCRSVGRVFSRCVGRNVGLWLRLLCIGSITLGRSSWLRNLRGHGAKIGLLCRCIFNIWFVFYRGLGG